MRYNGYNFSSGDEILFKFRGINFAKGKIYIYSDTTFYICHNEPSLRGSESPTRFGYTYSWAFSLNGLGVINEINDRDLCMLPFKPKLIPNNIKLNSRLVEFIYQKYRDIAFLFYLKIDPISRYTEIADSEDGSVGLVTSKIYSGKETKVSVNIKLSRLVRALVNNYNELATELSLNKIDINDAFVEKLHNEWKSYTSVISFQIKKGADIINIAYNSSHYHKSGHLKSCMTNCSSDLQMYKDNPEQINVIIFYKDNQVCGRTLIWKCTDGVWRHDRLYSAFDFVRPAMIAILAENKYESLHLSKDKFTAKLDNINYSRYPYLDSMTYFDKKNNLISNQVIS